MSDSGALNDRQKYVNDPRIACKYGAKCYQKNAVHHEKYKHPPPKRGNTNGTMPPAKRIRVDTPENDRTIESSSDSRKSPGILVDKPNSSEKKDEPVSTTIEHSETIHKASEMPEQQDLGVTPVNLNPKLFIKQKFLVEMPSDFYQFWDFCKKLNKDSPATALKDVGLTLVGPYDVLAGKFNTVKEQPDESYLVHWRYYHDPPECQTIIKGDEKTGLHIGYYRDSPEDLPVFLVTNSAKVDGTFQVTGDNIFAAVYLYLEDLKKSGDPFKKMHIGRMQGDLKKKAEELQLSLFERTQRIRDRDKKIVFRTFSKIGVVIPYNRKTQVGYRDLGVSNKELIKMLNDIQKALPEQKTSFLSKLQPILTNVSIATDECDFGAGIELGLDILAHGVDSLNQTISRHLSSNYRLIQREPFAKIAEAHMKNRKKGCDLSIV